MHHDEQIVQLPTTVKGDCGTPTNSFSWYKLLDTSDGTHDFLPEFQNKVEGVVKIQRHTTVLYKAHFF